MRPADARLVTKREFVPTTLATDARTGGACTTLNGPLLSKFLK